MVALFFLMIKLYFHNPQLHYFLGILLLYFRQFNFEDFLIFTLFFEI